MLRKEVKAQNLLTFEWGLKTEKKTFLLGFLYSFNKEKDKNHKKSNDTFYRSPVTSAYGKIGAENHPEAEILLKFDDDDYSQGCGQIKAF